MIDIKNIESLLNESEKNFKENEDEILKTFNWFQSSKILMNKIKGPEKIKYLLVFLNKNGECHLNYHRYKSMGHVVRDFLSRVDSDPERIPVLISLPDLLTSYRAKKINEFLVTSKFNSFSYYADNFDTNSLSGLKADLFEHALLKLSSLYVNGAMSEEYEGDDRAIEVIDELLLFLKNDGKRPERSLFV